MRKVRKGWRVLRRGTTIREGDRYDSNYHNRWALVTSISIGRKAGSPGFYCSHIRRNNY